MSDLLACLPLQVVQDLGSALLHFLWQGLLLAALLNVILPLCRNAATRHNWALATLAMMALAPVATFLSIHHFGGSGAAIMPDVTAAAGPPAAASIATPWTSWLVLLWLAGITILSLRALGGWLLAWSLTRRGTLAVPPDLLQRCQRLQRRLAMVGAVRFLLSRRVNVPLVIGWIRPVVLVPVSALTGLAPAQLDALILHELAHIRRLDTIVNILLVAVETILFYHPAIWWVGRRVRLEREHCCDDVAVSACGDAAIYVEALTSLEAAKPAGSFALAAHGGSLKSRAARLLDAPADRRQLPLSAIAGLAFLGLVIGSVAMAQTEKGIIDPHFAICVVDESVDPNALSGPPGDVRMPIIVDGKRQYVWLKREAQITDAMLAGAQAGTSQTGGPFIDVRLTPEGQKRFAALTRANVGHRIALVVNGTVVTAPKVIEPILGPKLQVFGFISQKDARAAASRMMAAAIPAPSPSQNAGRTSDGGYPSGDKIPVMLRPTPGTHTLVPYPEMSKKLGEHGIAGLMVGIGTDGVVTKCSVYKTSGSDRLDVAACTYVKNNWTWLPPVGRNGRPVMATTKVNVVFNLVGEKQRPVAAPKSMPPAKPR